MELKLERPGDHLFVRSVSEEGIRVVDDYYTGAIIVTPERVITDWPAATLDAVGEAELQRLAGLGADILLVGTGREHRLLPPELAVRLYQQGIGVETMSTRAACRTFNVLVSEQRRVAAVLMPLD